MTCGLDLIGGSDQERARRADPSLSQRAWPVCTTTHEAIYLADPDGNDRELAWDGPMEQWPRGEHGGLVLAFGDLDLDDLLTEGT
jgi:hypothetical protein